MNSKFGEKRKVEYLKKGWNLNSYILFILRIENCIDLKKCEFLQSADLLKGFNEDYDTECDILAEVPTNSSDFCGKEFVID